MGSLLGLQEVSASGAREETRASGQKARILAQIRALPRDESMHVHVLSRVHARTRDLGG